MARVLIGIPVLDNYQMTLTCLSRLGRYTDTKRLGLDVSVLLIDNGSREDIVGLARNMAEELPFPLYYRRNPINLGVAIAWNQVLRFSPAAIPPAGFGYDFYVVANNDALVGPDWLQPMVDAMTADPRIGWVSTLENGSPVHDDLLTVHDLSREHRINPASSYSREDIEKSIAAIYSQWGGHEGFCRHVKKQPLPLFIPYRREARSAVCFMVRPAMVAQIGFFDEDYAPVGIAEDLEYFLRMEQLLMPSWLTPDRYPPSDKWKSGFCGKSIVHHHWCSTRQGPHFDGRKWDKQREKNWRAKFGKSKKYHTRLFS